MGGRTSIGTLREKQLHAGLKQWLALPGDTFEQKVDNYHIDIVRGDLLIEIQTRNFLKMKTKLKKLLADHKVLLVHPVPITKWIVRKTKRGKTLSRRKSPKRGRLEHVFDELLYISDIASHPNFRLQVLLTEQEEIWRDDGRGSWHRKHWSIADRILLNVISWAEFAKPADYLSLVPAKLELPFTHRNLSAAIEAPLWLSTKMSYCLRKMGILEVQAKQGKTLLLAPVKRFDKIKHHAG